MKSNIKIGFKLQIIKEQNILILYDSFLLKKKIIHTLHLTII